MSEITRRAAIAGIGATLGAAAFAKAMEPIQRFTADISLDEFLQLDPLCLSSRFVEILREADDDTIIVQTLDDVRGVELLFRHLLSSSACLKNPRETVLPEGWCSQ